MTLKIRQPRLTEDTLITGEELYQMGQIGRSELIKGEIKYYMPTGHTHGYYELLIGMLILQFALEHKLGRAYSGEVGIYIRRNPDTVRAADIAFISNERLEQVSSDSYLDVAPELVVEIMSPDDRWSVIEEKLEDYFSIGVTAVWVVDPRRERIHVYHDVDQLTVLTQEDVLTGDEILPGLQISLSDIFA